MNKKSAYFFAMSFALFFLLAVERVTTQKIRDKKLFVSLTQLPDLALSQKTPCIRNRSLHTLFELYPYGQTITPLDTQSFTINIKENK